MIFLAEPNLTGNERKYLNECIDTTFVSSVGAFVTKLEQEVADIESIISTGSFPSDIYDRHAATTKQLENAMSLWELATLEYEEINSTK